MDRKERPSQLITLLASVLFHVAVFLCLLTWIDGSAGRLPAEKIITVDISIPEYHEPKPLAPAVPVKALEHRPPPRAKNLPQVPVLRTSPVPIAPIDSSRSNPTPVEGEMTVPQKVVPRLPLLGADQAGSAPVKETASGPPVAVHSPPRLNADTAKNRYGALLKHHIEKYREYPLMARKSGREGTCSVSCVLGRDGSVREVRIIRSSGHEILDRSALRAVRSVGRFPAVPREIEGDEVSFEVPISFSLSSR